MKRFLVFAGSTYYPEGGWKDFRGSHDTEEEAKYCLLKSTEEHDWWQITDTQTQSIVDSFCRYNVRNQ